MASLGLERGFADLFRRCKDPAFVIPVMSAYLFASASIMYADGGRRFPPPLRALSFAYVCAWGATIMIIVVLVLLSERIIRSASNVDATDRATLGCWMTPLLIVVFPSWSAQQRRTFQDRVQEIFGNTFCVVTSALEQLVRSLDSLFLSWKHQDIERMVRVYCEKRMSELSADADRREDACLVCLHDVQDDEPNAIVCPHCGQAYHIACFATYLCERIRISQSLHASCSQGILDTLSGRQTITISGTTIQMCLRCMNTDNIDSFRDT